MHNHPAREVNEAGGALHLRARSQAYRGHCEVAGARNAGTTVTVSLPIPQVP